MSFLTRIAMRAGLPGAGAAGPLLVPKDRGLQRSPRLARQEMPPEEEEVQTLRRQLETGIEEEEEAQTLRRQTVGEEQGEEAARAAIEEEPEAQAARREAARPPEEDERAQPARRLAGMAADDEEAQAVRRMAAAEEEEETVATSRINRMAGEPEEEEAQPVRRIEEDEEEAQPARPLLRSAVVRRSVRRAPAPAPEELGPETSPAPEILSDEPEPSNLRALGEAPPMPSPAPPVTVPMVDGPDGSSWRGESPITVLPPQPFAETRAEPAAGHFERPHVVIDRLDVLIHEPMAPARAPDDAKRRLRSFRARYLRRL